MTNEEKKKKDFNELHEFYKRKGGDPPLYTGQMFANNPFDKDMTLHKIKKNKKDSNK